MTYWPVRKAKACFARLLEADVKEGLQIITRRGVATAVLVPFKGWNRQNTERALKDWLLADEPRFDLDIPKRGMWKHRPPFSFDD